METYSEQHLEVAEHIGCDPEHLATVLSRAESGLKRERYYYYVNKPAAQRDPQQAPRAAHGRTIPAFPSPDDALAFAQYNHSAETPQVRSASKSSLLLTLLKNEGLSALVFLNHPVERLPLSAQPGAVRISRQRLLSEISVVAEI